MGVNTIIIQQEKMSVPAKILSEENLFTRPLNDSYPLEETQKEKKCAAQERCSSSMLPSAL